MTGETLLIFSLLFATVMGNPRAILEIVVHKSTEDGDYKTETEELHGHFTQAGSIVGAEGEIIQIHPFAICNNDDFDEIHKYGWVGVVKLEELEENLCMPLYRQARRAIERGATAVVFDITDNIAAAKQLKSFEKKLERPVIIIRDHDASRLMRIVNKQEHARARISTFNLNGDESAIQEKINQKEYFDMGIFVAVFVFFCIICVIVILKLKWRQRERQLSMAELTKRAIAKLDIRSYDPPLKKIKADHNFPMSDVYSQSSMSEACAICLEEYRDSQMLRVLPCSHEFHRECVDPWLTANRTCPLCMYNIMAHHDIRSLMNEPRTLNEIPRTSANLPRQSYDIPVSSTSSNNNDRNMSYHVNHGDYSNMQIFHGTEGLKHGCPSCEGTIGSSSSCDSYSYFRDIFPFHSGPRSMEHNYHNSDIRQTFQRTLCLARPLLKSSQPSLVNTANSNSGNMCSHYKYTALHPCRGRHKNNMFYTDRLYARTRLYFPCQGSPTKRVCESDPEYTEGSDRNVSITAEYGSGSCTSDGSVSNGSLACRFCRLHSDCTLVDSNHSTYGSSEIKGLSDVSSCNSSIYRNFTPDCEIMQNSNCISEKHCQMLQNSSDCLREGDPDFSTADMILDYDTDYECLCAGEAHCDHSSTTDSSTDNLSLDNSHTVLCKFCKHCGSVSSDLSLSGITNFSNNLSTDSLNSLTSHVLAQGDFQVPQLIEDPSQYHSIVENERDCVHNPQNISNQKQETKYSRLTSSTLNKCDSNKCSKQINKVHGAFEKNCSYCSSIKNTSSQNFLCSCHRTRSETTIGSNFLAERGTFVDPECHFVPIKCIDCSGNYSELNKSNLTQFHQNCACKQNSPRSSMVLFTEPQGAFITIPLGDQETYNPVNAV